LNPGSNIDRAGAGSWPLSAPCFLSAADDSEPEGAIRPESNHQPTLVVDMARKVVGVGSLGARAFIILPQGRDEWDPLFLQIKEATASVLEDHLPKEPLPAARRALCSGASGSTQWVPTAGPVAAKPRRRITSTDRSRNYHRRSPGSLHSQSTTSCAHRRRDSIGLQSLAVPEGVRP
jgi:hypothetical protein